GNAVPREQHRAGRLWRDAVVATDVEGRERGIGFVTGFDEVMDGIDLPLCWHGYYPLRNGDSRWHGDSRFIIDTRTGRRRGTSLCAPEGLRHDRVHQD